MYDSVRCKSKGTGASKKKKSVKTLLSLLCISSLWDTMVSMAMISGNNAGQPSRNWGLEAMRLKYICQR
jgi:hypothetical protein